MRYITDYNKNLLGVSFGGSFECAGQKCQEYQGATPPGYDSLEAWYRAECERLYRWQVVDGQLSLNNSAAAPECLGNYVEEYGKSDDGYWHWIKWANGWAACWGYIEVDISLEQLANGLYTCSGSGRYPITFTDYWPSVSGSCPKQAGANWVNVGAALESPNSFTWQFFSASTGLNGSMLPISISAAGRWKY